MQTLPQSATSAAMIAKTNPVVGLEIIRGAKKASGKNVWEDGEILDPENGRTYALRLTPIENGAKLEERGSLALLAALRLGCVFLNL
jgi:uncharacterized protein (DUF2147 family)